MANLTTRQPVVATVLNKRTAPATHMWRSFSSVFSAIRKNTYSAKSMGNSELEWIKSITTPLGVTSVPPGKRLVDTPADNDCFFHAFKDGLNLPETVQQLRDLVADRMETDCGFCHAVMKEWILPSTNRIEASQRMRHKEWASASVVHLLASIFSANCRIWENSSGKWTIRSFPLDRETLPPLQKEIDILYHSSHFDLLKAVSDVPTTRERQNLTDRVNTYIARSMKRDHRAKMEQYKELQRKGLDTSHLFK